MFDDIVKDLKELRLLLEKAESQIDDASDCLKQAKLQYSKVIVPLIKSTNNQVYKNNDDLTYCVIPKTSDSNIYIMVPRVPIRKFW